MFFYNFHNIFPILKPLHVFLPFSFSLPNIKPTKPANHQKPKNSITSPFSLSFSSLRSKTSIVNQFYANRRTYVLRRWLHYGNQGIKKPELGDHCLPRFLLPYPYIYKSLPYILRHLPCCRTVFPCSSPISNYLHYQSFLEFEPLYLSRFSPFSRVDLQS